MPGPVPKDPSVRARRNKSTTKAVLSADHDVEAPEMPDDIAWHSMTRRWWADIWSSPMAPEYAESDINGLLRVAMLYNDFWLSETPKERAEIQVRLEKADADYGTNPMARRRLEWQIEQAEDSKSKGQRRRGTSQPAQPKPPSGEDPRAALYVV
ncbi:hypothetical protein CCUG60885_04263 [Mycobacteroides salmoniphilum]|uniref:Bacteriophage protein n=2 Tax=Mycobacteroides salmoniphilum TaxID=404941 RepID=A0A4R8SC36_9MYCO|nr:hypothetical protein CCUG60885_04263 [Mycobacteroides salmoniphilum]TEA07378.1 hypothetical protein CCUG60883_01411 [Mycobacteroides salmoniphilum]